MMNPQVSVIIVNWNGEKYIKNCIDSILNQTFESFEIILVDNASTDNSVKIVEKNYPNVKIIINSDNVGFATGNNVGIAKSKGELILLFNPDAVADKDFIKNLVSVLQSSENMAAASGKILYLGDEFGKNAVFCTWPKIDPYTAMPYNFHDNEPMSKVDYLSGAAMLVKKSVIEKIGLLDEGYFLYFEETDWCARMIRAGYDLVYSPNAVAWHVVSASVSNSERKTYYMERSRIRFAIKNFDPSYVVIFSIIFLVESLFVFIRDIKNKNFSRSKIRLRAIYWNLSNLRDILRSRKRDLSILRKNTMFRSYNKSLPLADLKVRKS